MNGVETTKLQFDKLQALLDELLKEGFGEIQYRIVAKNKRIEYVSLTKTNTFRIEQ